MAGASRVKLFFDKETGLLSRVVRYSKTIVGPVPTQIDYSDYREVAGVKIAISVALDVDRRPIHVQSGRVKPNVAIDPAKFAKPVAAVSPRVAPVAP